VLYTDGLIERRDASIDIGTTRLLESLHRTHVLGVERISDLLMDNAASHEDDIALLVLRG
jgi:serine phosphatase RsbU (regulator of sigma subunit)